MLQRNKVGISMHNSLQHQLWLIISQLYIALSQDRMSCCTATGNKKPGELKKFFFLQ